MAETDLRLAREVQIIKQSSSDVADGEGVQNLCACVVTPPRAKEGVGAPRIPAC